MGIETGGYVPEQYKNMSEKQAKIQATREAFDTRMDNYAKELGIEDTDELRYVYGIEEDNLRYKYKEDLESTFESLSLEDRIIENIKSGYDSLTGIPNRITLIKDIEKKIEDEKKADTSEIEDKREKRKEGKFSFIMIDVDKFKSINDTYGHDGGDYVLREICKVLKQSLRSEDTAGRWGGEEIAVIASNTNGSGPEAAERIREIIKNHEFVYNGKKIDVTISAGVAPYNENIEVMKQKSDVALYAAKGAFEAEVLKGQDISEEQKGEKTRNQVWYFDDEGKLKKYIKPEKK
ncbi:MAG: hypothetical protein A2469_02760 [Candidatus Magasanikbacteria bacterium RIFOXYC2_FULL_40_16]|uniref:GGDEF domain-containing protein n=3 Tax=Candidatus Magasanikiibacteriota TaxID=1752731 RepID=A0A1F6NG57_9BACT|nr:MAG: hypothetical protein A2224_01090 [Candidatus Magasanikbacteria bacterium RIFOXYA2_FULL_40_20]OGH82768.1 MAG: hypothetical protein A2373_02900 [Candidatus Magasanikbacteria bacterium RIFOXYB1_FULL_40_15]OGH85776.1 MAG: hypothetical protein A2301_02245 [Candidatus Magasanikbacteria bacterium RIFOXYB2_FULL_40_13]OGH87301.1 MAG: hypothetical protein A2206_02845 [Candidatus Magasanikbacteria bacterium RIFOXYA1_FULL_40_8]OGH89198.1 MAG: hypothetical protein A2469_02760 [Candidatus Magasanikba